MCWVGVKSLLLLFVFLFDCFFLVRQMRKCVCIRGEAGRAKRAAASDVDGAGAALSTPVNFEE